MTNKTFDFGTKKPETTLETNTKIKIQLLPNIKFLIVGMLFGILFIKAEIISWYRIQEMFRFQSFHMFGVIGSAVFVGIVSVFFIKKYNIKTISGEAITMQDKKFNKGNIYGGLIFGAGWAITGACPGPIFAQIGTGVSVMTITLIFAIIGTWLYGFLMDKLPH